ncbi:MAG: SDR family NAD(P)-dependent oxidoreductase [Actinomycetota bacterium]
MEAFATRYGPWAVVVGAAQGIGAEFCRRLAARKLHLIMVALEDEELRELARDLEREQGIQTKVIVGDITSPDVMARLDEAAGESEAGMLVCNAALSSTAAWLDTSLERHLAMVDVNVRAPLTLIDRFVRPMAARGRGGLILLSSMSALQGSPMVATYAATKAFTLNLAESLWDEFRPAGVDVLAVVPGPTDTPGYRASAPRPTRFTPKPMSVEPVVAEALEALGSRPWIVPGRANSILGFVLSRILPRRAAIRFMGRTMRSMYGGARGAKR